MISLFAALFLACLICVSSLKLHRIPTRFYPHEIAHSKFPFYSRLPMGYSTLNRGSASVKIQGGYITLGTYYTTVEIGNPKKEFNLLLDTGSSNLAVNAVNCTSCGPKSKLAYDAAKSSTAKIVPFDSEFCRVCNNNGSSTACLFGPPFADEFGNCGVGISYGGGTSYLTGSVVQDVVSAFGMKETYANIVSMSENIPESSFTQDPLDGIIGLAFENNAVVPTYLRTLFSVYVDEKQIINLFSLCLTGTNGGVLDMGIVDDSKISSPLLWIPIVQQKWYNMPLIDVFIGDYCLELPPIVYNWNNDQIGSFIDSGTGAVLFGPVMYARFQQVFQKYFSSLVGVTGASNIFNGATITNITDFPTIYFKFEGFGDSVILPFTPASYFMLVNNVYSLTIQSVPGISVVLGDPFMSQFYIVHDRENLKLGFAKLADGSCH